MVVIGRARVRLWRRPQHVGCSGWSIAATMVVSSEGVVLGVFLLNFLF